jgi:hypothetical protein
LQIEFFLKFQTTHPKKIVGQKVFESLKLFYVKALKRRNTCCIYHTKINELQLALNQMQTDHNGLHGNLEVCDCACGVICGSDGQSCQASNNVCKGIIQLWEVIVCPKNEFDEWYK